MINHTPEERQSIKERGRQIRFELFEKFCRIQEGHPGSILSIFDIVNVLYLGGYVDLGKKSVDNNDVFIMSKGHAAAVQYPYLVEKGVLPDKEWDNWGREESCLRVFGNHSIPGVDVTSGSLGHGIGIASGMALANRMNKEDHKIYVVISEGELYEGSSWEAFLFIAHHKLAEVKIILDVNRNMILGRPEDNLKLESLDKKFEAFDIDVMRINGHDYDEIFKGLNFLEESVEKPRVLIADTIKGKGVSFMEDTAQSHYWGNLSEEQMATMLKDLSA